MRLPMLKNEKRYKQMLVTFGGINLLKSFSPGEMTDCSGISHISFPAITQRQKNEKVFSCNQPAAAIFTGKECVADSTALYYDGKKVGELSEGEKQLCYMGTKVIVFPDKVYYDIKEQRMGNLNVEKKLEDMYVSFSENSITVKSNYVKTEIKADEIQVSARENLVTYEKVTNNATSFVFSGFALKKASELTAGEILWERCSRKQYRRVMETKETDTGYIIICELCTQINLSADVFADLKKGDVVEISGCTVEPENNKMAEITEKEGNTIYFAEGTFAQASEYPSVVVKRKVPDMSCICCYENRLWGCEGNTIYASALGDPTNFFVYKNLSTDSYSVESNTLGDFTGCVAYGNCCLFFKENACYKLYGNKPSNFQLTETFGSGVAKSEAKSIVNVNGKIFYNGNGGVFVFYGGIPQCVSGKIEGLSLRDAVAGSDGRRYYITANTSNGREELVFDAEKGLWSKSGITDSTGYSYYGGQMYRFASDGIYKILPDADEETEWSVTLCPFDEGYYKTKNYMRLYLRAQLYNDAWILVEAKRDNEPWREITAEYGQEKKHINIPFTVRNCHELQLRLSGRGKCVLEALVREFSVN